MSSLISSIDKNIISSVFDDLHDTYGKEVYVYTRDQGSQVVDESNYNPIFGANDSAESISNDVVLIKTAILARVNYDPRQTEDNLTVGVSNIPISRGRVRLKVHNNDWDLVKNSVKIEIDNDLFVLDTDPDNLGPFTNNYKCACTKGKFNI